MTHADPSETEILQKLDRLKSSGSFKQQPQIAGRLPKLLPAAIGALAGLAIGLTIAIAAPLPTREAKASAISNDTLEWLVYEIAKNNDITPALARQILEKELGQ